MLVIALLSLAMLLVDYRFSYLDPARRAISTLMTPIYHAVDVPYVVSRWAGNTFASHARLRDENETLRARMIVLEGQVQKMVALGAEVSRLRDLLNASAVVDESVVVSEIISVNPDPYVHEVIINKGYDAGTYVGQPVLGASGLVGQVVDVSRFSSRVLLISDSSHAVPVQVNRNGMRAIAFGVGTHGELELVNVAETADIEVGDLLVSSGLGGRFPVGYPVGTVTSLEQEPGQPFLRIRVQPAAELDRIRHVLLVFKREPLPMSSTEMGRGREESKQPSAAEL